MPSLKFDTHTWVPSEEMQQGALPTGMVRTTEPVEASISVTVLSPKFAVQTWAPSDEIAVGLLPTGMVATTVAADAGTAVSATVAVSAPPSNSDPASTAPRHLRTEVVIAIFLLTRTAPDAHRQIATRD